MKAARIPVAVAIVSLVAAGSVFADRTLWLQTDEGMLEIPLKPGQNMSVLADGNVSAAADDEFVCSLDDGASCEDVDVSLTDSFSSFTITPSTVSHGGAVSISWRSRGAWECVGGGLPGTTWNTGNPRDPAGSATVNTSPLDADANYSVSLECSNGPVKATRTVSLNVTESDSGTPDSCSGQTLLGDVSGWSLANNVLIDGSGNPNVYTEVFPGSEFPGTTNNFGFYLPQGRFAAMQFTVPSHFGNSTQGSWSLAPITSNAYGAGLMYITVSKCPGDFDVANFADDPGCATLYSSNEGTHTTRWSTDPNSARCTLTPGESYYMNVAFIASENISTFPPEQSSCGGRPNCGVYLRARPGS